MIMTETVGRHTWDAVVLVLILVCIARGDPLTIYYMLQLNVSGVSFSSDTGGGNSPPPFGKACYKKRLQKTRVKVAFLTYFRFPSWFY